MPNLTIEYKRSHDESVADAQATIRKIIADRQDGAVVFYDAPSWREDGRWVTARVQYRFTEPGDQPLLEPIRIDVVKAEPEPEPPQKKASISALFKRKKRKNS